MTRTFEREVQIVASPATSGSKVQVDLNRATTAQKRFGDFFFFCVEKTLLVFWVCVVSLVRIGLNPTPTSDCGWS